MRCILDLLPPPRMPVTSFQISHLIPPYWTFCHESTEVYIVTTMKQVMINQLADATTDAQQIADATKAIKMLIQITPWPTDTQDASHYYDELMHF